MRILSNNVKNELTVEDPISGEELTVYYRMPSVVERIKYSNEMYGKTNGKLVQRPLVRLKFGAMILTGIKEKQFANEKGVAISSDENSKNYDADWKAKMKESAPEILMYLGFKIFEGMTEKTKPVGSEIEIELKEGEAQKPSPFGKN